MMADLEGLDKPLLAALRSRDLDLFKTKLDDEAVDPNLPLKNGRTILFYAAEVAQSTNNRFQSLRENARRSLESEFLDLCLGHGRVDKTHQDENGRTVLSFALDSFALDGRRRHVVEKLLDRPEVISKLVNFGDRDVVGRAPLTWAAEKGYADLIDSLVDCGAAVNFKDNEGRTPLSRAAEQGHIRAAELLISHGATVDSEDNEGRTPLSRAAEGGCSGVVELLINRGARVNSRDNNGRTPLSWAAVNWAPIGDPIRIIRLLCASGACIASKDNRGQTPLMWAVEKEHNAVVQYLLERQETLSEGTLDPLEEKCHDGHSLLSRAVKTGKSSIANPFLDRVKRPLLHNVVERESVKTIECVLQLLPQSPGITPKVDAERDDDGRTALHVAVKREDKDIVKALLDDGAFVSVTDVDGRTPLHEAAKIGVLEITALFLEQAGVGINIRDRAGRTPLRDAMQSQNDAVVDVLLEYGASIDNISADDWSRSYKTLPERSILQLSEAPKARVGPNASWDGSWGHTSRQASRRRSRQVLESLPRQEERNFENGNKLLYVK